MSAQHCHRAALRPRGKRRRARRVRRLSLFGVVGELLLTAGVLILLFLGWQLWWNDAVIARQQTSEAAELRESWGGTQPTPDASAPVDVGRPVVAAAAALDTSFGNLYIPRYGAGWVRTIAEGIDAENVLDKGSIGHYPGTQMPGDVGNVALAAHRSAYGGGMHLIDQLQIGDPIYLETADGWYTYRFRTLEYVQPTEVQVIEPLPWSTGSAPTDRLITLTSCNPLYSTAERIIAYGVFESWQQRSAGAPAALAAELAQKG